MSARATRPFSREHRIRGQAAIDAVRKQGSRIGSTRFVFLVYARAHGGAPRLGITVSRKYGNAVARNRFKRLMREAFRNLPSLLMPGTDLMVMARGRAPQPPARGREGSPPVASARESSPAPALPAASPVGDPGSSGHDGLASVLEEWRAAEDKIRKRAQELHDRLARTPDPTQTAPGPSGPRGRGRRT